MRSRFEIQPGLSGTPIENVRIPLKSRDELPPILAGLQWIFVTPEINEKVFTLLERRILADKKPTGRTGMDLWHILVLGTLRLGLDANWDRLEHIANFDTLVRQILGVADTPWGHAPKTFHRQTLRDNAALVDDELLQEINSLVAFEGRSLIKKKEAEGQPFELLKTKTDTYVLETNVHFPTDLNLLFDSGRKCLDLVEKVLEQHGKGLTGWRKIWDWSKRFKAAERMASKTVFAGGKDKELRVQQHVGNYLKIGRELSLKTDLTLLELCTLEVLPALWDSLRYFHEMLKKHLDLVDRRLIQGQTIPAGEKIYSIFEPDTEWITKGKLRPNVELGHRVLITTDQNQLIVDYAAVTGADCDQSLPVADRLMKRFGEGSILSMSFDKGFTREEDRQLLGLVIPTVIMPKRGKKNREQSEREGEKEFVKLRRGHSAVESNIASLEHHGLNRCPDKGLASYKRYVGFGVLAYNLHQIGRRLLEKRHHAQSKGLALSS